MLWSAKSCKRGLRLAMVGVAPVLLLGGILFLNPVDTRAQVSVPPPAAALFIKIQFCDGHVARGAIATDGRSQFVQVYDPTGTSIRLPGWTWKADDLDNDGEVDDVIIRAGSTEMWLIDSLGGLGEAWDPSQGKLLGYWSAW
jgi:hypothetical protein